MEASEVEHIWRDSYVTKAPNGQFGHDDDDFGPETDVDAVHDVLSSGFPAEAAKAKALVAQSQTMEEWLPQKFESSQKEFLKSLPWTYADALKNPKPKSPDCDSSKSSPAHNKDIVIYEVPEILEEVPASKETPKSGQSAEETKPVETLEEKKDVTTSEPKKESEETGNAVAEAEVDSADDSEEEWNYIPGKNDKKTEKKQQVETPERPSDQAEEEDDMSQLNPNAAEFVPVFGTKVDTVLASSPAKGAEKSLEDIKVPKQKEFLEDISTKPAELDNIGYESSFNENSVNGIDVTVDSSKAECGSDSDCSEEADDVVPQSSNPFAEDKIQHQMVSDYFGENQSLGFKPFDPMQNSMLVLDSTPSPTNPTGSSDLYDFLSNPEKPDLLSPIDNFSNTNNEQQKSSSSGFESESGNEIEVGSADKCDLVAGIPHDNGIGELPVITQRVEEYPETNPFSIGNTANEIVEKLTEQSLFFGEDKFEPVNPKEPLIDDAAPVDELDESKPPTLFSNESESEKNEEPQMDLVNADVPAPVDQVDLISGTVTADSNADQINLDFSKNFEQSTSEVPTFEYSSKEVDIVTQSVSDGILEEHKEVEPCEKPKEVEPCELAKEQEDAHNAVASVAYDKSKDESAESDFEIISHDDAELNHVQEMNGVVHLDEVEPSADNYKFDDLVQKQHTVEIHAEKSSFEPDFMSYDRPATDVNSGPTEIETSDKVVESSDKQNEDVGELIGDVVETTSATTDEVLKDDALVSLIETEPVEPKEKVIVDSIEETVQLIEPAKEETIIESFSVQELTTPQPELKQEELVSPVDDASSELDEIVNLAQDKVSSELDEIVHLAQDKASNELDEIVNLAQDKASSEFDQIVNSAQDKASSEFDQIVNLTEDKVSSEFDLIVNSAQDKASSEFDQVVNLTEDKVSSEFDQIVNSAQDKASSEFNHIVNLTEDKASSEFDKIVNLVHIEDVKSPVDEVLEKDLVATTLESKTDPFETQESLPVTPSAPLSEDLLSDTVSNKEFLEEIPKDVEPKPASQGIPDEISEEIQAVDLHQQNGDIAEVATPPSTPAPGVEPDNKDGLIAAAVAAAGVASVAAVATAVSGDAKPDDKTAKKPASKPLSSARPSSAKAPTKPGMASAAAKKPAAPAAATKAPVSAAKTTAAKPSAAKPLAAKPTTTATKPASPLTKTSTTAAAKPKPTSTTATKAPATKTTVGATTKPPTPTTRTAPAVSKTAPLAKPKTPPTTTTATPAPIKRPAAPGTVAKTAAPITAKKTEPSKPLASKTAPAPRTTTAAPRPTSASKPTTTTTARPTSATKPAARPVTSTTTKMAAPSAAKPAGTTKLVAAKTPAATPASRTSTATKAAPGATKTAAATKTAPPKPRPATTTVLKKPAAADKNAKDAANKSSSPKGPIRRPVSDKTKVDNKAADKESEKIAEPPMQEPIVSTTNGHIDIIENGVSHSDESPVDVNPCSTVEAQN